jgi:SAM-dependent methyltransferase
MRTDARAAYDAAAEIYDEFTAHHDYDGWTALIERLAREHGLAGRRLLDAGCGTGKSFLPLLARGYDVVAFDLSPAMAAVARAKSGGRARVIEADVRDLPRLGAFDLVLALDDVVNYVARADLAAALAGLRRNLARGGVLVFDANTELTYRTFFAETVTQRGMQWRGHVDADAFAPGGTARATLTAPGVVSRHTQHHHPPAAVRAALASAGLRAVHTAGMGLDGALAPLDETVHTKALYVSRSAGRP